MIAAPVVVTSPYTTHQTRNNTEIAHFVLVALSFCAHAPHIIKPRHADTHENSAWPLYLKPITMQYPLSFSPPKHQIYTAHWCAPKNIAGCFAFPNTVIATKTSAGELDNQSRPLATKTKRQKNYHRKAHTRRRDVLFSHTSSTPRPRF